MRHLLLLESDADLRAGLEARLKEDGFQLHAFAHGAQALAALPARKYEAAILDWTLPSTEGLEVLRAIRQDHRTRHLPVLLMTGRQDEIDQVLAQNLWADDYASKPVSVREIGARLAGILRRAAFMQGEAQPRRTTFGPIAVDLTAQTATYEGKFLDLTHREFELLAYLVQNPHRVLSRQTLLRDVWGLEYLGESRTIDAHIRRVRAHLDPHAHLIETIMGVGYRLGGAE